MSNPDINSAVDVIVTRCSTAAAALSPAIADVARGAPVPGPGESVRVWYAGEGDPPKFPGGATVNSDLRGEQVVISCYFPVSLSGSTETAAQDRRIFLLKDGIRRGILAGSTLGGNVTDLDVGAATAGFSELNGTPYRVLELRLTLSFTEYPIAA